MGVCVPGPSALGPYPRPSALSPHLVCPRPPKYCKKKFMNKHITYSRYTYSALKYYTCIQDIQKAI